VGPLTESAGPAAPPERRALAGRHVTLAPLSADRDAAGLYAASHGDEEKARLWTYLTTGPFDSEASMRAFLQQCEPRTDQLFLTVQRAGIPIGMTSFMNIVPEMRRLELGNIWYTPSAQKSAVNTEAIYLMLAEAFDRLGYRRVEWKCDALNAPSRAAALRLGFRFEGIFRQHMIIRGRNRDTAWFALVDGDWPAVKANLQRWLYSGEEGLSLRALNVTPEGQRSR
jgi:RimJ/RimL family protein N-acetyltransferase